MPSNVVYLAIAKKYLEVNKEENVKEFYRGIISNKTEKSHSPDLNEFYKREGLKTSFNKGCFVRMLADYLFYNNFLNKISPTIISDFEKANKKIIDTYGLEISEDILENVSIRDGELEEIKFESICRFIDDVSKLDIEKYSEQIRETDKTKKIFLEGRKEGLLYKYKGKAFLCDETEVYLYGFENNYGLLVEKTMGGAKATEGAEQGLYKVSPIGIALKPSEIWIQVLIAELRECLEDDEIDIIIRSCGEDFSEELKNNIGLKFENMSTEKVKKLCFLMKKLPSRIPKKVVDDTLVNLKLVDVEKVFIK